MIEPKLILADERPSLLWILVVDFNPTGATNLTVKTPYKTARITIDPAQEHPHQSEILRKTSCFCLSWYCHIGARMAPGKNQNIFSLYTIIRYVALWPKVSNTKANYCYLDFNLKRLGRLYHWKSIKRHLSAYESQAFIDCGDTHRRVNIRTEVLLRFNPVFSKGSWNV